MTPESRDNVDIARQFIEALNQGERERFGAFLAPDATWHSAATGETETGQEDVARNLFGYRGTFPDLHEEICNAFASGEQVAVETVVTGTYDGAAVPTIVGSGRHVTLRLCYILRVRGGKIDAITTYMDYRTLMAQLDVFMPPSTAL